MVKVDELKEALKIAKSRVIIFVCAAKFDWSTASRFAGNAKIE